MIIQKFNDTIDIWIRELNRFNLVQLLKRPDEQSWSLGQLYQHIIADTNWSNGQIKASLKDVENTHVKITKDAKVLIESGSFPDEKIQAIR
jgi:hypothetical protein